MAARMMQYATFGDRSRQINTGEHLSRITIMLKHVGVTFEFD